MTETSKPASEWQKSAKLVRCSHPEVGHFLGMWLGDNVHVIQSTYDSVSSWLRASVGRVGEAIEELITLAKTSTDRFQAAIFNNQPTSGVPYWLAPIDGQDVWAAGVTYERSRTARQEEAFDGGNVYARVYVADRPEIFFKAQGWRAVGPFSEVGIRNDASWSVPEPELALVMNPAMEVVGFTMGNDMSSRDIEGANPLYLPQAKIYTASCALGPGIVMSPITQWPQVSLQLNIIRHDEVIFQGSVHTKGIRRTIRELVEYLGRSNHFPDGVVLLTGTGIIPPDDFSLQEEDIVEIGIEGMDTLINYVRTV